MRNEQETTMTPSKIQVESTQRTPKGRPRYRLEISLVRDGSGPEDDSKSGGDS